jgi:hypothetical protein
VEERLPAALEAPAWRASAMKPPATPLAGGAATVSSMGALPSRWAVSTTRCRGFEDPPVEGADLGQVPRRSAPALR